MRTDVLTMVNPLLTLFVDLVLIGTALFVIGTMVREYLQSPTPNVGNGERERRPTLTRQRRVFDVGRRLPEERRRVA